MTTSKQRWTGLSLKEMGWAEYSRQRRNMLGKNKTGRTYTQPTKQKAKI